MARIIWMISISVDGYMEGPDRDLSWHMVDDELHSHLNGWLRHVGGFIEGRITYELMEEYWPTADQDPGAPPTVVEFAEIWRAKPKIVYSRTLDSVGRNATLVHDFQAEEVLTLKSESEADLVIGGSHLAAEFVRHDLIDEYRLYIHPVIIGQGTPTLRPSDAKRFSLELKETQTFGNGVVMLRYERSRSEIED